MARSILTEDKFQKLLFEGSRERFTQDSPILPEVWFKFALQPAERHALLLTPLAGTKFPKSNLVALRRDFNEAFSAARVAFAWLDESVLVTADWSEVLRLILPRTAWFQELTISGNADTRTLVFADFLDKPFARLTAKTRTLFWLLRLIAVIELNRRAAERSEDNTPELEQLLTLPLHKIFANRPLINVVAGIASDLLRWWGPAPAGIYSIALNRPTELALLRSRQTVKADAAERVFGVRCNAVTWAVIDSGIDARHRGFRLRGDKGVKAAKFYTSEEGSATTNHTRVVGTYDFSLFTAIFQAVSTGDFGELPRHVKRVANNKALIRGLRLSLEQGSDIPWNEFLPFLQVPHTKDYVPPDDSHGTHVAGILGADVDAGELADSDAEGALRGICPDIRLIDLRVFGRNGLGDEFSILAALQFVRYLNRSSDRQRVHGVNLSISLRHIAAHYACGSTPVCRECDRLVGSGVVVVAAAGNLGYSSGGQSWTTDTYRPISITDPGNAEKVITVGSTHRDSPHTYGVSYFSSRGPTGDGRSKPDLVAPGEKILSLKPDDGVEPQDGTSMAAPHVSGVAAMLLARYPELAGHPERIKQLLCSTALDLGRERNFQGAGLVDALKALQSI